MRVLLNVAIFVLCLSAASAFRLSHRNDRNLMDFMLETRSLQQRNPELSDACFKYYMGLLSEINEEYEKAYGGCLAAAEGARDNIDDDSQPKRDEIEGSAKDSCEALAVCAANQNSIDYFECFSNAGAKSSKSMYTISADAAEELAVVREKYRLIDVDQYRCTNASERVYVESSAQAIEDFRSCLQGDLQIPTTPSPEGPTTAAPEEPSTAAPEEPSTAAPEEPSTAAPEEPSTAAPEEPSTAAPEEPSTAAPEEPSTAAPEEPSGEDSTEEPSGEGSGGSQETPESNEDKMPEEDLTEYSRRQMETLMRRLQARFHKN